METSHYAKKPGAPNVPLRVSSARSLLSSISKNFGTLPFCRRYLDRLGHEKYLLGVRHSLSSSVKENPRLTSHSLTISCQAVSSRLIRPCATLRAPLRRNLSMSVISDTILQNVFDALTYISDDPFEANSEGSR